jgi:hypothetical protein
MPANNPFFNSIITKTTSDSNEMIISPVLSPQLKPMNTNIVPTQFNLNGNNTMTTSK